MGGIEEYLTDNFEARKTQNTYRAVQKKYFEVIGESPERLVLHPVGGYIFIQKTKGFKTFSLYSG